MENKINKLNPEKIVKRYQDGSERIFTILEDGIHSELFVIENGVRVSKGDKMIYSPYEIPESTERDEIVEISIKDILNSSYKLYSPLWNTDSENNVTNILSSEDFKKSEEVLLLKIYEILPFIVDTSSLVEKGFSENMINEVYRGYTNGLLFGIMLSTAPKSDEKMSPFLKLLTINLQMHKEFTLRTGILNRDISREQLPTTDTNKVETVESTQTIVERIYNFHNIIQAYPGVKEIFDDLSNRVDLGLSIEPLYNFSVDPNVTNEFIGSKNSTLAIRGFATKFISEFPTINKFNNQFYKNIISIAISEFKKEVRLKYLFEHGLDSELPQDLYEDENLQEFLKLFIENFEIEKFNKTLFEREYQALKKLGELKNEASNYFINKYGLSRLDLLPDFINNSLIKFKENQSIPDDEWPYALIQSDTIQIFTKFLNDNPDLILLDKKYQEEILKKYNLNNTTELAREIIQETSKLMIQYAVAALLVSNFSGDSQEIISPSKSVVLSGVYDGLTQEFSNFRSLDTLFTQETHFGFIIDKRENYFGNKITILESPNFKMSKQYGEFTSYDGKGYFINGFYKFLLDPGQEVDHNNLVKIANHFITNDKFHRIVILGNKSQGYVFLNLYEVNEETKNKEKETLPKMISKKPLDDIFLEAVPSVMQEGKNSLYKPMFISINTNNLNEEDKETILKTTGTLDHSILYQGRIGSCDVSATSTIISDLLSKKYGRRIDANTYELALYISSFYKNTNTLPELNYFDEWEQLIDRDNIQNGEYREILDEIQKTLYKIVDKNKIDNKNYYSFYDQLEKSESINFLDQDSNFFLETYKNLPVPAKEKLLQDLKISILKLKEFKLHWARTHHSLSEDRPLIQSELYKSFKIDRQKLLIDIFSKSNLDKLTPFKLLGIDAGFPLIKSYDESKSIIENISSLFETFNDISDFNSESILGFQTNEDSGHAFILIGVDSKNKYIIVKETNYSTNWSLKKIPTMSNLSNGLYKISYDTTKYTEEQIRTTFESLIQIDKFSIDN